MTDEELFTKVIDDFEVVETMIDDEFSRRDETSELFNSINMLISKIKKTNEERKFANCIIVSRAEYEELQELRLEKLKWEKVNKE